MPSVKNAALCCFLLLKTLVLPAQNKAVFIILDGISADVIERVETPFLDEIASSGKYFRCYVGGKKGSYSQSPTVSAAGYNHLLTGTWSNKHNVWDNTIKQPNYNYPTIFRLAGQHQFSTGIFSTWTDNRTKLIGEGMKETGNLKLNYAVDGLELDEVRFPYTPDKLHYYRIDEQVSQEAARHILEYAPDVSWVYLQYTDDVGHLYGDSEQYDEAVKKADAQVGRVWRALQEREKNYNENWLIVVTTDHGRDSVTGKGHGNQSERERTTWLATNAQVINNRITHQPAIVDIMPTLTRHLNITLPAELEMELDGVAFTGKVSVANLNAVKQNHTLVLTWDALDPAGRVEILVATTDNFKKGQPDNYHKVASVPAAFGKARVNVKKFPSDFYKVVLRGRYNTINTWVAN